MAVSAWSQVDSNKRKTWLIMLLFVVFITTLIYVFAKAMGLGLSIVGIALILGAVTGIAAFFGAFMNINYLFAGTVSTNPELLLLEIFIMLAWKTAGWYGLDRFILPQITACKSGKASKKRN